MRKILTNFILILSVIGLFTSCASLVHGTTQTVNFSSQPSGAKITINDKYFGVTPKLVKLKRRGRLKGEPIDKKEYVVKIELEGYHPYEMKIKRAVNGWFFGNVLIGGLVGFIVDAGTGAMYKLKPQVMPHMSKSSVIKLDRSNDKIYVAVTFDIDPDWEKIGTMEKIE